MPRLSRKDGNRRRRNAGSPMWDAMKIRHRHVIVSPPITTLVYSCVESLSHRSLVINPNGYGLLREILPPGAVNGTKRTIQNHDQDRPVYRSW